MKTTLKLLLSLVFALLLVGCGGGEEVSTPDEAEDAMPSGDVVLTPPPYSDQAEETQAEEEEKEEIDYKQKSQELKPKIDAWLAAYPALNEYGEPMDTVYSPDHFIDKESGEELTNYEYVLKNHPEFLEE